ncbi:hypothetical protein [Rubripirellula reticaptiva]|uniref:Secreted protein n=1 Tax=Rubripirellula reticaptiva TaxID=2528013 RepID=A0A5C6F475_9BACT|nr:hypothetical protein [Rubripirellula reticaptiva]TWU55330.1 hypothetical protein Poly59_16270 [Rubripirellula reticaptiva]
MILKSFQLLMLFGTFGLAVGCGNGGGGIVEQTPISAADAEAQQKAYEAEMNADSTSTAKGLK